jgi:hypothetical protein
MPEADIQRGMNGRTPIQAFEATNMEVAVTSLPSPVDDRDGLDRDHEIRTREPGVYQRRCRGIG